MTRNPTLVLGLGRTGSLVARELQALLPSGPETRSPWFLLFGSPPAEEGDVSHARIGGPRNLEEVSLPMDLMRETMSGVREWSSYLPWLSNYDDSSFLDEIRPLGAAGYRSFARLTTVRCDGLIDQALRRALNHAREVSPAEDVDVLLIAGAGGGLGSALLADLTFLIRRHARKSTRTACLVLPPPGVSGRARFDANAFATLCEVATLKGMRFPYEIRFESLPSIETRAPGDEPWQRVYLFEAERGEDVPYPGAARQVAERLALQMQPRVARYRRQVSQDFTSVRVSPGPRPARLEKAFSACQGLTFEFPKEVPGVYRDDPITQTILDRAWEAFLAAFDRDLLTLREPLYEARKQDLGEIHTTLGQREDVLIRAVSPEPAKEATAKVVVENPQGGFFSKRRNPRLRFDVPTEATGPLVFQAQALKSIPGMEDAFLSIHRDLKEPPPSLPVSKLPESEGTATSQRPGRDLLDELNELRKSAGSLWPADGRGSAFSLRRNMVWNLKERFATLQALLRAPDFRGAFDDAVRALAHEWLGYRKEVIVPDPSFGSWLAEARKAHPRSGNLRFHNRRPADRTPALFRGTAAGRSASRLRPECAARPDQPGRADRLPLLAQGSGYTWRQDRDLFRGSLS